MSVELKTERKRERDSWKSKEWSSVKAYTHLYTNMWCIEISINYFLSKKSKIKTKNKKLSKQKQKKNLKIDSWPRKMPSNSNNTNNNNRNNRKNIHY